MNYLRITILIIKVDNDHLMKNKWTCSGRFGCVKRERRGGVEEKKGGGDRKKGKKKKEKRKEKRKKEMGRKKGGEKGKD